MPKGDVPQMHRRASCNPNLVLGQSNAALEQVAYPELAPDLPHVDGLALVGEGRAAGHDRERLEAAQSRYQVCDDAIREVVLRQIRAEIGKGQDRDSRLSSLSDRFSGRNCRCAAETISNAGNRYDPILPAVTRPQCLAKRGDLDRNIAVLDHKAGPDPVHDLLFGDNAAACRH